MTKIVRITTVPISLKVLLKGQLKFMKEKGFEMIAISSNGDEIDEIVKNEECTYYKLPLTRQINPFLDVICIIKLIIIFYKIRPTIVHSHTPKAGLVAMIAAAFIRVPVKLHTIAGLPWSESSGIKKKILKCCEIITIWCSDKTYVNSMNLMLYLEKENIKSDKLCILGKGSSNGIDINKFQSNKEIALAAQALITESNLKQSGWIWIFIGRLVKQKGIQELVDAFEMLLAHYPNDQLWLVGSYEKKLDDLDDVYKQKIKSNPNIIEWGFQNDVRPYLEAAKMLVFPSYREGFPNVPLQAALLNCGLILSDINGCNEIVKHQYSGLLFSPKNVNDTFEKMIFARKNEKTMLEYNRNAQKFIIENFNKKVVLENLFNEYKTLIKQYVH